MSEARTQLQQFVAQVPGPARLLLVPLVATLPDESVDHVLILVALWPEIQAFLQEKILPEFALFLKQRSPEKLAWLERLRPEGQDGARTVQDAADGRALG